MGIAVAAPVRQAQGITAVNARKLRLETVFIVMDLSYPLHATTTLLASYIPLGCPAIALTMTGIPIDVLQRLKQP
jgi:hypothetical protein